MDIVHPATIVRSDYMGRRVRVHQLRRTAAIAIWLVVIAVIVLLFAIGSRPAPPDFESLTIPIV